MMVAPVKVVADVFTGLDRRHLQNSSVACKPCSAGAHPCPSTAARSPSFPIARDSTRSPWPTHRARERMAHHVGAVAPSIRPESRRRQRSAWRSGRPSQGLDVSAGGAPPRHRRRQENVHRPHHPARTLLALDLHRQREPGEERLHVEIRRHPRDPVAVDVEHDERPRPLTHAPILRERGRPAARFDRDELRAATAEPEAEQPGRVERGPAARSRTAASTTSPRHARSFVSAMTSYASNAATYFATSCCAPSLSARGTTERSACRASRGALQRAVHRRHAHIERLAVSRRPVELLRESSTAR